MRKIIILQVLLTMLLSKLGAQISAENKEWLHGREKSLQVHSQNMINAEAAEDRFASDSMFIRGLLAMLKTPYSFYHPFDSIKTVSILYPPDSSFRVFSWQVQRDEAYFRQYGAIQLNTLNGSLSLYPLFDVSDFVANPTDSVRQGRNWIGAIYYGIVQKEFEGKRFYTLLGYDDNDYLTTRKWIEVLWFDQDERPMMGGDFFEYPSDDIKPPPPVKRLLIEYKKDAGVRLKYDTERDLILLEHLVSLEDRNDLKHTLVPDGDFEAFQWKEGKWRYIEKVFHEKLEDGQAPVPVPIFEQN
jgi:hypothetical protein